MPDANGSVLNAQGSELRKIPDDDDDDDLPPSPKGEWEERGET